MIELNQNFKWIGRDNIDTGHRAKVIEDIADACRVGEVGRVLSDPSVLIRYYVSRGNIPGFQRRQYILPRIRVG